MALQVSARLLGSFVSGARVQGVGLSIASAEGFRAFRSHTNRSK